MRFFSLAAKADRQRWRSDPQAAAASVPAQITQFLVSGGLATLVHWAVMGLLVRKGLHPVLATGIGAFAGSILNYVLQFYWTFRGNGTHGKAIPAYAGTVIFGWSLNAGLFYLLFSIAHVGLAWAQIVATAAVAIMNFIIYKRIVFHERIIGRLVP